MDSSFLTELERLTFDAAFRREELLARSLKKYSQRMSLSIACGVLSLFSTGAIIVVIADRFANTGFLLLAAISSALSATMSFLVTARYTDDAIERMRTGISKYLAVRESIYSLVINPYASDRERRDRFRSLRVELDTLDELYSRYFSQYHQQWSSNRGSKASPPAVVARILKQAEQDVRELHRYNEDRSARNDPETRSP